MRPSPFRSTYRTSPGFASGCDPCACTSAALWKIPSVLSTQNVPTGKLSAVRATPNGPAKIGWPPFPSATTRFRVVVSVRLVLS